MELNSWSLLPGFALDGKNSRFRPVARNCYQPMRKPFPSEITTDGEGVGIMNCLRKSVFTLAIFNQGNHQFNNFFQCPLRCFLLRQVANINSFSFLNVIFTICIFFCRRNGLYCLKCSHGPIIESSPQGQQQDYFQDLKIGGCRNGFILYRTY